MSWLTKFLGFDEIIVCKDGEIVNLYSIIHDYKRQLVEKDQEIRRLTDLMLIEHGVIHLDQGPSAPAEPPKAINRRPSWNQMKTRYEEADAKLAAENTGKLREYWVNKDQEARKEGVI